MDRDAHDGGGRPPARREGADALRLRQPGRARVPPRPQRAGQPVRPRRRRGAGDPEPGRSSDRHPPRHHHDGGNPAPRRTRSHLSGPSRHRPGGAGRQLRGSGRAPLAVRRRGEATGAPPSSGRAHSITPSTVCAGRWSSAVPTTRCAPTFGPPRWHAPPAGRPPPWPTPSRRAAASDAHASIAARLAARLTPSSSDAVVPTARGQRRARPVGRP